ncbi:hypothetical protein GGTG_04245 [Gaeumannomyces tritici R3-111a-1]|uniref:Myb-like domain-containing protein n=1 Tax=Gaeumannomyces tritici (strain R3-111a-1) TaxID=644352 RepID=J3NSJ4_GAET3|nr:hypothetical protein GGTG_04245 [Gaeumannomyces tritici R3-111a-1]EJT79157.1 hypothetical protein GGTG_04245 [Gaeumannomyces tritici R3-111a-1]
MASFKPPVATHFANSPVASRTRRGKTSGQAPTPTPTLGDHQPGGIAALAAAASSHSDADQTDRVHGARRGPPRGHTQDQSIHSIHSVSSEPLEQTRPDQSQDATRRISASPEPIPYFDRLFNQPGAQETPSKRGQQIMARASSRAGGRARALNKRLPWLRDAAKELHDLLSYRALPMNNTDDFVEELEVARDQLAALSKLYRDKTSESRFISSVDITTLLAHPPDSRQYLDVKNIACIVNLGEFSCSLFPFHAHDAGKVTMELLSQLDTFSFPLDFTTATLLDRDDWKERTIELAIDVRTQLAISRLQKENEDGSPQKVILDAFCTNVIKTDQDISAILDDSSQFKSLPGCDYVRLLHPELDVDQIRKRYAARCETMLQLLGADSTVTPEILANMVTKFPPRRLVKDLQAWIETTLELFEDSLGNGSLRNSQALHAQVEYGHHDVSASQESMFDVSSSAIQDFMKARDSSPQATQRGQQFNGHGTAGGDSTTSPSASQGLSRKRARAESDAGPAQDDDEDDPFQFDNRAIVPNSQSMPPPPPPRPSTRAPGNSRRGIKRVRREDVPVDPSLTGHSPSASGALVAIESHSGNGSFVQSDDGGGSRYSSTPALPDIEWLSQQSKAVSLEARQRNPKTPQKRTAWSTHDCTQLIRAICDHEAKWSKIAAGIKNGEIPFDRERDQQALRDKARLLKVDMLKTDQILSPGFDNVVLGRKERRAVEEVGRNPERKEADMENGIPTNTMRPYPDHPEENQAVASSVPPEERRPQPPLEERSQGHTLADRIVD